MGAFLDEVMLPFYSQDAPIAPETWRFGQIFSAPAYYPHQQLKVWRPSEVDRKIHTAKNFNIVSTPLDAFKRALPYSFPPLNANEEFIAITAKPRPVVLIQPPDPGLKTIKKISGGIKIVRQLCVVAPVFSIVDAVGYRKVPDEFRNRVRQLEYPQFLFLPSGGPLTLDSLLRLDELQSLVIDNLTGTPFCLALEVAGLLKSQIAFFLSRTGGEAFLGYRDLLRAD